MIEFTKEELTMDYKDFVNLQYKALNKYRESNPLPDPFLDVVMRELGYKKETKWVKDE